MSQALRRRQDQLSALRAEIAETEEMLMTALSAPSNENSTAIAASCQSKMTSMMEQETKLQDECRAKSQALQQHRRTMLQVRPTPDQQAPPHTPLTLGAVESDPSTVNTGGAGRSEVTRAASAASKASPGFGAAGAGAPPPI